MNRRGFLWKGAFGALGTIASLALPGKTASTTPTPEPVLLCTIPVAGTQFYHARNSRGIAGLASGEPLNLQREPTNRYDSDAIEIFTSGGHKLGYVPRVNNDVLARLLDHGVTLMARIVSVRQSTDPWERVHVAIYMQCCAGEAGALPQMTFTSKM